MKLYLSFEHLMYANFILYFLMLFEFVSTTKYIIQIKKGFRCHSAPLSHSMTSDEIKCKIGRNPDLKW